MYIPLKFMFVRESFYTIYNRFIFMNEHINMLIKFMNTKL